VAGGPRGQQAEGDRGRLVDTFACEGIRGVELDGAVQLEHGVAIVAERHQIDPDEVVALHLIRQFVSVGTWYGSFSQLDDAEVIRLIGENRRASS
jgi:hypothetical protein